VIAAHAPHSVVPIHPHPGKLAVVTAIANPARYRSRYRLYRQFAEHVAQSGADLYTVEVAFGSRPFEITEAGHSRHIQLRSGHELWFKENALNIGISRLPADIEYIAVVDADFTFARPDWVQETIQQLQHFAAVQMFNHVAYLDVNENIMVSREGFASLWSRGSFLNSGRGQFRKKVYAARYDGAGSWGPPGGAWAFRRSTLNGIGGLIDYCILGSADFFMAYGLIGKLEMAIPHGYGKPFADDLLAWQMRAMRAVRSNVGVVPGTVLHHWHGSMQERNYHTRESILINNQYNPLRDVKRDIQGLWQLEDDGSERFINLRDDIRSYFRVRNEDALS
jgi:hypothetical protein